MCNPETWSLKLGKPIEMLNPFQWQYPTRVLSGWSVRVRKLWSYVEVLDKPFLMVQVRPKLSNKYAVACHWVPAVPHVIFPATWIYLLAEFAEGKRGTLSAYRVKIRCCCTQYSLFYNIPLLVKKPTKSWLLIRLRCLLCSVLVGSLSLLGHHI